MPVLFLNLPFILHYLAFSASLNCFSLNALLGICSPSLNYFCTSVNCSRERPQDYFDCIVDLREYDVPYHVRFAIDNGELLLSIFSTLPLLLYLATCSLAIFCTRHVLFLCFSHVRH